MAIPAAKLYGVTNSLIVSDYLVQYNVSNANLPGTDIIDNKIDVAAADFDEALSEGGFSASSITEAAAPIAYERARDIVATRAALMYSAAVGHNLAAAEFDEMFIANNKQLARLRAGKPFGELTVTGGSSQAVFKHGTDTRTTINNRRALLTDNL